MVVEGAVLLVSFAAIGFGLLWRGSEQRCRAQLRAARAIERRLLDATASARQANEATARLRDLLDALPTPVWRRRDGGELVDCNLAYAAAVGSSRRAVLAEGGALVPAGRGGLDGQTRPAAPPFDAHVVVGGKRRLLEINERSGTAGETVGFALDRTEVENAQDELRRHIGAHAAVLESLSAAVAIFGPDKRLDFFNTAFTALWGIDADWLGSEPSFGDILERLHESRRFPEYPDFRAFKRECCELFNSLTEPRHELMYLPDGRTLHLTISPHPRGGLAYVYDDVSDRLRSNAPTTPLPRSSARPSTISSRGSRSTAATAASSCTTPPSARSGACPRRMSWAIRISARSSTRFALSLIVATNGPRSGRR